MHYKCNHWKHHHFHKNVCGITNWFAQLSHHFAWIHTPSGSQAVDNPLLTKVGFLKALEGLGSWSRPPGSSILSCSVLTTSMHAPPPYNTVPDSPPFKWTDSTASSPSVAAFFVLPVFPRATCCTSPLPLAKSGGVFTPCLEFFLLLLLPWISQSHCEFSSALGTKAYALPALSLFCVSSYFHNQLLLILRTLFLKWCEGTSRSLWESRIESLFSYKNALKFMHNFKKYVYFMSFWKTLCLHGFKNFFRSQ